MQDPDWNDLKYVLAVFRTGTLAGAARSLGVNETTVARRIARADERIGTRLFDRTAGQLRPTTEGFAVIEGAERVEREIQAAVSTVSGRDARVAGTVRITAVPLIVNRILVPALRPLLDMHPDLRIELIAEPRDLSLTKRQADIAIRLARPGKELGVLTRRLGDLAYAVYGPAGTPVDALPWITYEDGMAHLPQNRWMAERRGETAAPIGTNDAETIIESVRAGLGKSLLPIVVGEREPDLARLDSGEVPLSREIWIMFHPDLRGLKRIETTMNWLEETIASM